MSKGHDRMFMYYGLFLHSIDELRPGVLWTHHVDKAKRVPYADVAAVRAAVLKRVDNPKALKELRLNGPMGQLIDCIIKNIGGKSQDRDVLYVIETKKVAREKRLREYQD